MNNVFFIIILQAVLLFPTFCGAQKTKNDMRQNKTLVAYFSATGTTARAAERLAQTTGGDLYRITPKQPYTAADLNWHDSKSRSSVEMNNPASRPQVEGTATDIANYDVILIGYPIWWDAAPRIINTFIEKHDLKDKTIKVFATSGSSGIGASLAALKKAYPQLQWSGGLLMNSATGTQIRQWIGK